MNYNYKKGVSLLVLVITIIIVVILAGAAILTLSKNNPINAASESVFKSDIKEFESDLTLYITHKYGFSAGSYNSQSLSASELTVEYRGEIVPGETIKDVIPSLSKNEKYNGQFEIVEGKLVYLGTDITKKRWAEEANIQVVNADRLNAVITSLADLPIVSGTDIPCIIIISSNSSINNINLTDNLELLDENNVVLPLQPVIEITAISGSDTDTLRNVDITIKTDILQEGKYKLKIKANSIFNIYDITNEKDIITNVLFEIDSTPPTNPEMIATPTGWTNGNVMVEIVYPLDSVKKEYSTDGENWSNYTSEVEVTANNTTVYARAIDVAGNQSSQSTITIANIDKTLPTAIYGTNGGTNLQTASTTVTASDLGGSNISTLQYVWDTQNIASPSSGWTAFTSGDSITKSGITGTYYLWIKVVDNAGNIYITKSNAFVADNTAPVNPTMLANPTGWTNGNVTVTITYPVDATVKEYSTDGATWTAYTTSIIVSTNAATVYARCYDASGNQSSQSTITIANIDKTLPTIIYGTNGGSNVQTPSTTVTVSDLGGSTVNTSTLQYVWDTQNVATPVSGWTTFTNGATITKDNISGTYYLWIKASDNAGNASITKSNAYEYLYVNLLSKTNEVMSFNGTSTYIDTQLSPLVSFPNSYSVAVRYYATDKSAYRDIFGGHAGSNGVVAQYDGNGLSVGGIVLSAAVTDNYMNKWVNMVYTYDYSTKIEKLYMNNNLVASQTRVFTTMEYFWLGKGYPAEGRYFLGSIEYLGIWNKALTDQEISDLNSSGKAPLTNLVYKTTLDSVQNVNNSGTVYGGAPTIGVNLMSKTNQVMSFNGTSTYIDTQLNPVVSFPNNYSVAVKYYATDKSAYRDIFGGHGGADGVVAQFDGSDLLVGGIIVTSSVLDTYMNKWVNMVYTYDYSTKIQNLYMNNTLVGTSTRTFTTMTYFWIGKGYPAENRYFLGNIEYLAVWNRALTVDEIKNLYNCGNISSTNLVYKATLDSITNINSSGTVYVGTPTLVAK